MHPVAGPEVPEPSSGTGRPAVPVPVRVACWIWVASAALSAAFPVLVLVRRNEILAALRVERPANLAPDQYGSYVRTLILVYLVTGALFVLLYLLFAWHVRAGRNWARITVTVFTGLSAIYDGYAGASATAWAGLAIGAAAVLLVYLPVSRPHFDRRRPASPAIPEVPA